MVLMSLSLPQLVLLPPLVLLASGVALFNFQNLFRFLSSDINNLKYALEQVLGKASTFKFNLSHVLMMAVVIMLMAVYNAIQKGNQLQEQQIKLMLARQKAKRD